jgi:hypothetical protein
MRSSSERVSGENGTRARPCAVRVCVKAVLRDYEAFVKTVHRLSSGAERLTNASAW